MTDATSDPYEIPMATTYISGKSFLWLANYKFANHKFEFIFADQKGSSWAGMSLLFTLRDKALAKT